MNQSDSFEKRLRQQYNDLVVPCTQIMEYICDDLKSLLSGTPYIDSITGRVKSKKSFLDKVIRDPSKYDPPVQQVEDIIGLRVLVYFRDSAELIYNNLANSFCPNVENMHKEPPNPNQFGYEGYHLIQSIPKEYAKHLPERKDKPVVFEIQVKTLYMHAWSQPEHLLRYKNKKRIKNLPENIEKKLAWLAATSWGSDSVMHELKEWLEEE